MIGVVLAVIVDRFIVMGFIQLTPCRQRAAHAEARALGQGMTSRP